MSFQISASAPKKNIREAIETANRSYERTEGYGILDRIPEVVEIFTEAYHEDTLVSVTVTGSMSDAATALAINLNINPNGLNPNPPAPAT